MAAVLPGAAVHRSSVSGGVAERQRQSVLRRQVSTACRLSLLLSSCCLLSTAAPAAAGSSPAPPDSSAASRLQLPNTAGIDGELTARLGVDRFFSLWIVFNNEDVAMSEKQFTILAPRNNASLVIPPERVRSQPEAIRKLLLDHVVLGQRLDLGIGADLRVTTLGGRTINIKYKQGSLVANGARVQTAKVDLQNGRLIILEDYLFPEDMTGDHSFLQDMYEVLSYLKSGVRVFQHLLGRTNVTKLLKQDGDYTVLVPTDSAFQRWHPIDWGFYPFSVPEFTEEILTNHFIHGNIRQKVMGTQPIHVKTLGNKEISFYKTANGSVFANGVEVVGGDTPLSKGNMMLVTEVLFVDEGVVRRLHDAHRDKETPPLLAFPWFGAQFLSHAFLSLEADRRFSHISRFLNVADLVPHLPGHGYTFFVPLDSAFKSLGLDSAPDNLLSSKEGLQVLLSHFVKGRLYDKDIRDNASFTALSGRTLHVRRAPGTNGTIEEANIVEREVFVYNLGTMFYLDNVLFGAEIPRPEQTTTASPEHQGETESSLETGTYPDLLLLGESDLNETTTEEALLSVQSTATEESLLSVQSTATEESLPSVQSTATEESLLSAQSTATEETHSVQSTATEESLLSVQSTIPLISTTPLTSLSETTQIGL